MGAQALGAIWRKEEEEWDAVEAYFHYLYQEEEYLAGWHNPA